MGLIERAARAFLKEKESSWFMQTERDNLLEAIHFTSSNLDVPYQLTVK